jgi:hypothetical protein
VDSGVAVYNYILPAQSKWWQKHIYARLLDWQHGDW